MRPRIIRHKFVEKWLQLIRELNTFARKIILALMPISSSYWIKQSVNIFTGSLQTIRDQNINFLEENVGYVASTCPNRFKGQAEADNVTFSLVGTPGERFAGFLDHCWQSQAVYYSVVRTAILRQCDFIGQPFWAADWAIDLFLASRGNINRTDDGLLELGVSGDSSRTDAWRVLSNGRIEAVLPFFTFSAYALKLAKSFPLTDRVSLFSRLMVLNWRGAYGKAFTALYQRYKAGLHPMLRGN
jgi:hypothetical protein